MAKAEKAKPADSMIFPQRYWVVAADLSLKRPGFCKLLCDRSGDDLTVSQFETTSVDNKKTVKPHGELLHQIVAAMHQFFPGADAGVPIFYVREKAINSRAAMSEIGIFKVVGVSDWFLYDQHATWAEIYPVTVKKLVTGSGKADKQQVADMLPRYFGSHDYANDDESDAAAVAAAFLIQQGQMKPCVNEGEAV